MTIEDGKPSQDAGAAMPNGIEALVQALAEQVRLTILTRLDPYENVG